MTVAIIFTFFTKSSYNMSVASSRQANNVNDLTVWWATKWAHFSCFVAWFLLLEFNLINFLPQRYQLFWVFQSSNNYLGPHKSSPLHRCDAYYAKRLGRSLRNPNSRRLHPTLSVLTMGVALCGSSQKGFKGDSLNIILLYITYCISKVTSGRAGRYNCKQRRPTKLMRGVPVL